MKHMKNQVPHRWKNWKNIAFLLKISNKIFPRKLSHRFIRKNELELSQNVSTEPRNLLYNKNLIFKFHTSKGEKISNGKQK